MVDDFNSYSGPGAGALITSVTLVKPQTVRQGETLRVESTGATENELVSQYARMAPELRKSLAIKLNSAGYKVPITGEYSSKVRDQFIQASRDFNDEIKLVAATSPGIIGDNVETVDSFLTARAKEEGGGTTTQTYKTIYTDAKAGYLVDAVFSDLTGRKPSDGERQRYIDMVQNLQSQTPTAVQTISSGGSTTEQGIGGEEVKQYLIDEIAGTDDAKRVKIQEGYSTILEVLGVSR